MRSASTKMPRKTREKYDHLVKVLLLGDSAVGKSSLLLRFCEKRFDSYYRLTIGIDFKSRIIEHEGKRYKLQIWDTAGQERFRTITPAYFRSAMGVIFVYDVTNLESFENLSYWVKTLGEHSRSDLIKVIVGNKLDLQSIREVSEEKGRTFAAQMGAPFFEVSAKNNHSGAVDGPFLTLTRLLVSSDKLSAFPSKDESVWRKTKKVSLSVSSDSDSLRLKLNGHISEESRSGGFDFLDELDEEENENDCLESIYGVKEKGVKSSRKMRARRGSETNDCDSNSDSVRSLSSTDEHKHRRNLGLGHPRCC